MGDDGYLALKLAGPLCWWVLLVVGRIDVFIPPIVVLNLLAGRIGDG